MCGIAGFTLPARPEVAERGGFDERLRRMVASLRHRGPDSLNGLLLDRIALGHARLSILDPVGGTQPMVDEATGVAIVFNGEIFNHPELRERLAPRYRFRTRSDTEVLLASYLAWGIGCVEKLNGQFAFAIFDPRNESLHLGRDRFGICPLYWARARDSFLFASEARALFASGAIEAQLAPDALLETLHLWAPTETKSLFRGVHALPPGCVARLDGEGRLEVRRYWDLDLADDRIDRSISEAEAAAELESLLEDAIRIRLRADVPVAAYLSGGLDSSLLCALAQRQLGGTLQSYSVAFEQERYDEEAYQCRVAAALGTRHRAVRITDREIGESLPQVVAHAEAVLLRSAPAPLYRLSRLVHDDGTRVVLTGEGADEIFVGYDLFKETQVRQFWARQPASVTRPALFRRLYPWLDLSTQSPQLVRQFYGLGLDAPDALAFSHLIRWTNSGRIARFLSPDFQRQVADHDPIGALLETVPAEVRRWRPLARARYLEAKTLLSQYLLTSQGDRMLMAHSVEGRFPFLDHRLSAFAAKVPDRFHLRGLTEKALLRRVARGRIPAEVAERQKFPYRAPIAEALTGSAAPSWSRELLRRQAIDEVGVFDGAKVERLLARLAQRSGNPSEADNMAIMAIASTQLLAHLFLRSAPARHPDADAVEVRAA